MKNDNLAKWTSLLKYLACNKKVLIWGSGRFSELLSTHLENSGLRVHAYIDTYASTDSHLGKPLFLPQSIPSFDGLLIVIATSSFEEVSLQCEKMGFSEYADYLVALDFSYYDELDSASSTSNPEKQFYSFDGSYLDDTGAPPIVNCKPGTVKFYSRFPVIFSVDNGNSVIHQEVLYSSLTLLKLIKECKFDSVLDIGSHSGNVSRIFNHLGKKTTMCEIAPGYDADYKCDYLDVEFDTQFDAIWCSQVLEHQRNVGFFLNKIYDDLKEGGVLALTVPFESGPHLNFGHCNHFNPLILIYHLVMAGFNCSDISLLNYNCHIGVILNKRSNQINRFLPNGTLPLTDATEGTVMIGDTQWSIRDLLGEEVFEDMADSFPKNLKLEHAGNVLNSIRINWGDPI